MIIPAPHRFAGFGAVLVAAGYLLFGLFVLEGSTWQAAPWWGVAADYALALAGLFGLAAVPALTASVSPLPSAWLDWTSRLAQIGFGLLAVTSFWQAEYELSLGVEMLSLPVVAGESTDPSLPPILLLFARLPNGWLEVAGVGLWIFSLSWLAEKKGVFPTGLLQIGLALGILSIAGVTAGVLQAEAIARLALLPALMLLLPLWFGWAGIRLLRESQATPRPAQPLPAAAPRKPRRAGRRSPVMRIWRAHRLRKAAR